MGRRIVGAVFETTIPPHEWPAWVLRFARGTYPDDRERQAEALRDFDAWRRDRDAWRREHTDLSAGAFLQAARRETLNRRANRWDRDSVGGDRR